jgi:SAM-dependent methyltransferase
MFFLQLFNCLQLFLCALFAVDFGYAFFQFLRLDWRGRIIFLRLDGRGLIIFLRLDAAPVEFRKSFVESLDLADASVDVVISNCVINLVPDKRAVFGEIFRVLREGGEVFVSDIFIDRRLKNSARDNKQLVGERIGNAIDIHT